MADASKSESGGWSSASQARNPEEIVEAVRQHLRRILESPSFQGSKRCQEFLQYVVDRAMEGQYGSLKERVIGAEVFGRPAGYETSGDAIVRVKANEVRKRLAQYYLDAGGAELLRINLPAGSYSPTFTWLDPKGSAPLVVQMTSLSSPASPVPSSSAKAKFSEWVKRRMWLNVALGALLTATIGLWLLFPRQSALDSFWAPIIESTEPVVVCASVRDDYIYSPRISEALATGAQNEGQLLDFRLHRDDVVRIPNGQMSLQSLRAVLDLATFLAQHGRQAQFRTPADVSFEEIRHKAVVLVGSFYNPWAKQLSQELRYGFDTMNQGSSGAVSWIRDAKAPGERKWTVDRVWPYHTQPVDYAIISRVFDSPNQRVIVSAAGMSRFGAQVAGEFLTAPKYWKSVGTQAPRGWERMNCQIILETRLIGTTPGPPKVVATHFW